MVKTMPSITSARRQRDLQRREDLILDAAEDLLSAHGYLGLNLDQLAERVEYSKGTIYNHFETKEDIVLALASRYAAERVRLFERAATFQGRSRERMVAILVANDVLAEVGTAPFQIMQLSKTASLWEKTSLVRQSENERLEGRCLQLATDTVSEGIVAGDLNLDVAQVKEISLGLMTMSLGTHLTTTSPGWSKNTAAAFSKAALRANQHRLLDGVGWRPLSTRWDYAATETRLYAEVFPTPKAKLGASQA